MIDYSELLKVDIITGAYSQMRIAGLTVSPTPDDLELALIRLEDMAAEFSSRNMSAGFNLELTPDPNSAAGIPRAFKQAYETNLAIRLIPDFNKNVPQMLLVQASQSAANLAARTALQRETPYPARMPIGSGNSDIYRWTRFYTGTDLNPATTKSLRVGDVNEYSEDFSDYLNVFEYISSFTINAEDGIDITASDINNSYIDYTISIPESTNASYIDIQITTTAGRVERRRVYFNISE